jgi:nicotinate-nucleotide--dimethylbenzimidazole phosphoribosyltransferase
MRIPVMLDGFITCAAIAPLIAHRPDFTRHCIAAHGSAEAAHEQLLARFGLEPLLRLGLRLGEGSGAALAVPLVRAALVTHNEMATFAQAAVATSV